ncbi:hypothetical protein U1Q18_052258 [Sarracenia purpurea var. burkii]
MPEKQSRFVHWLHHFLSFSLSLQRHGPYSFHRGCGAWLRVAGCARFHDDLGEQCRAPRKAQAAPSDRRHLAVGGKDIDAVGIDAETASLGIWRNAARGKWDRLFTGANAESAAMVLDPRPPPSLWRVLSCRTMFRPDRVTFHVTDGTLKLRNLGGNDLSLALTTDEFSVLAERRQFEDHSWPWSPWLFVAATLAPPTVLAYEVTVRCAEPRVPLTADSFGVGALPQLSGIHGVPQLTHDGPQPFEALVNASAPLFYTAVQQGNSYRFLGGADAVVTTPQQLVCEATAQFEMDTSSLMSPFSVMLHSRGQTAAWLYVGHTLAAEHTDLGHRMRTTLVKQRLATRQHHALRLFFAVANTRDAELSLATREALRSCSPHEPRTACRLAAQRPHRQPTVSTENRQQQPAWHPRETTPAACPEARPVVPLRGAAICRVRCCCC